MDLFTTIAIFFPKVQLVFFFYIFLALAAHTLMWPILWKIQYYKYYTADLNVLFSTIGSEPTRAIDWTWSTHALNAPQRVECRRVNTHGIIPRISEINNSNEQYQQVSEKSHVWIQTMPSSKKGLAISTKQCQARFPDNTHDKDAKLSAKLARLHRRPVTQWHDTNNDTKTVLEMKNKSSQIKTIGQRFSFRMKEMLCVCLSEGLEQEVCCCATFLLSDLLASNSHGARLF